MNKGRGRILLRFQSFFSAHAKGGVDVDGAGVAVSDEAEVVRAAGGRDPAVLHARAEVQLEALPELRHRAPAIVLNSNSIMKNVMDR